MAADLLQSAHAWQEQMRRVHCTHLVTYHRAAETVEVPATVDRTVHALAGGYGPGVEVETRDFLISASDLVLGGVPTEPRRGDKITDTVGGVAVTYSVAGPGGGVPDWIYADANRLTFRVHVLQVNP